MKPKVSFIAWARTPGRSLEIAEALDGEAFCSYPFPAIKSKFFAPFRYLVNSALTIAYLARRRPKALIIQNPPIIPGLIGACFSKAFKAPFVLDSHPVAFGGKGQKIYAAMSGLHRWLALKSSGVTVASEQFAEVVQAWGVEGIVIHEAPVEWSKDHEQKSERPSVFFVCIFAHDEPYREVIKAAALVPDVNVIITGRVDRLDEATYQSAPKNVEFCGYLDQAAYKKRLQQASIVMSLTAEPGSVMRSAYEGVYAGKPLIVTDWPNLRRVFPYAVTTENTPDAIAAAVSQAVENIEQLKAQTDVALKEQLARWEEQLERLKKAIA